MDSAGKMVICCTVGIALLHAIYGGTLARWMPGLGFCRLKHVLEKLCDLGKPCTLDKYKLDEGDDKPQFWSSISILLVWRTEPVQRDTPNIICFGLPVLFRPWLHICIL
jgi:hypothetical protein